MNAIIIAAGSGKRIGKEVKNVPKSMVNVNGKPIIEHQLKVLKQAGINDVYVITGPNSEKFNLENVKYVKDQNYSNHDILGSLMEAKEFLKNWGGELTEEQRSMSNMFGMLCTEQIIKQKLQESKDPA